MACDAGDFQSAAPTAEKKTAGRTLWHCRRNHQVKPDLLHGTDADEEVHVGLQQRLGFWSCCKLFPACFPQLRGICPALPGTIRTCSRPFGTKLNRVLRVLNLVDRGVLQRQRVHRHFHDMAWWLSGIASQTSLRQARWSAGIEWKPGIVGVLGDVI